jgi:tetratricopeptide (TPR) repeat protein
MAIGPTFLALFLLVLTLLLASCNTTDKDETAPLGYYHHYQGIYYYEKDRLVDAVREFEKALSMSPNSYELHLNLALAYLGLGELDKAAVELNKAKELNPNSAAVYSAMGEVYLEKGRPEDSIAYLNTALKLNSKYADAHNNLGNAYWRLGWHEQAISEYKEAIEVNPNICTAYINLGTAYKELNRLEESLQILKTALELDSRSPEAYHCMADVYFKQGKWEEAVTHYKRALMYYPTDAALARARAYGYLGLAYYKGGMRDKALSGFKEVAELAPAEPLVYLPKEVLAELEGMSQSQDRLMETRKFAEALSSQGKAKEASSLWKDVLEEYLELRAKGVVGLDDSIFKEALSQMKVSATEMESTEHHLRMGNAYLKKGNTEEALKEFKKALREDPTHLESRLGLARAFFLQGELESSQRELKKLLFLYPGTPRARLLVGNVLLTNGIIREAEATYKELLEDWPKSAEVHNGLGIVYTQQGRLEEAIKEYSLAAELAAGYLARQGEPAPGKKQPSSGLARIHVNLGRAYYRKGNLEAARQGFNKALELAPQQPGALEGLGLVFMAQGKLEEAKTSLEKALSSMGLSEEGFLQRAEIRSALARLYAQSGRSDMAIHQWLEVVESRLREIQRLDRLGLTCFDKGDLQQAFFYWQKSLLQEPSLAVAYENLGQLYAGREMLEEGLLVYRNAAGLYREPGKKAQMHLKLGNLRSDRWELEEAISEYRRAIEMEPGMAMAYTRLGRVYGKKGLLEKAEREHKKALELDPKLAEAHKNLGLCYNKQGQPGQASKEFKKYLELTPKE